MTPEYPVVSKGRTIVNKPARILRLMALFLLSVFALNSANAQENSPLIVKPGAPGEPARVLTPEQSVALGQSHYTPNDVSFMQNMIIHHAQAVEMSALIKARTSHHGIGMIGKRITLSQEGEIEMMGTWLKRRKQALVPAGDHSHHKPQISGAEPSNIPVMHGMLSPRQMVELAAADKGDFERLYLTGMIQHHQGAIDMVNMLLSNAGSGEDPEMSEFLSAIVADQSGEILRMLNMMNEL